MLFGRGGGHELEGGRIGRRPVQAAAVANDTAEGCQQRTEAVGLGPILERVRVDLLQGRGGALRGGDRIAAGFGRLMLISEQQRTPSLDHVPLDVVSEHAQKDMRAHASFPTMADGPHFEIERLQGAERPLDLAQALVAEHRVRSAQARGGDTGADHVQAIERCFGGDLVLIDREAEVRRADVERVVLGHLVLVDETLPMRTPMAS